MKILIFILLLAVGVSAQTPDQMLDAISKAVGAGDKAKIYVQGETVAANVINTKEVYSFLIRMSPRKNPQATVDAIRDRAIAALKSFDKQFYVRVIMVKEKLRRVPTGETRYSVRPTYISTWCSGNTCTSRVSGGLQAYQVKRLDYQISAPIAVSEYRSY